MPPLSISHQRHAAADADRDAIHGAAHRLLSAFRAPKPPPTDTLPLFRFFAASHGFSSRYASRYSSPALRPLSPPRFAAAPIRFSALVAAMPPISFSSVAIDFADFFSPPFSFSCRLSPIDTALISPFSMIVCHCRYFPPPALRLIRHARCRCRSPSHFLSRHIAISQPFASISPAFRQAVMPIFAAGWFRFHLMPLPFSSPIF